MTIIHLGNVITLDKNLLKLMKSSPQTCLEIECREQPVCSCYLHVYLKRSDSPMCALLERERERKGGVDRIIKSNNNFLQIKQVYISLSFSLNSLRLQSKHVLDS